MSSNTNIGNTPVNQGYVQLIHTGETGGIDGTLRTLYDGDGTASDLQIASNKVKVSTELYIGSKTATEFIQDIVGDMFTTGSYTNITTTYDDTNGNIDLSASGEVTLTGTQTLTNKTLASPTFTGTANGVNLTLSGDLTVNGTTTTLDTTNLKVTDNLIELNQGVASNANDSGIIIERGSTGDNAIIMWDESADKFTLGTTTATADATGNITITTGTLVASTFEGNLTGNVTGSASLNLLISNNLSDLANAATARSNLGVDAAGTDNSTDVTLAGSLDYITLSGQQITRNAINLTTDVTGTLPASNGGTGLTSISTLLNSNVTPTSLGLVIGTDVQAQDTLLQDIADFSLSNPSQDGYLIAYSDAEPQLELVAPGISFNGSTANGLLTYGNSTTADVETDLVYTATGLGVGLSSPDKKLEVSGDIKISGGDYNGLYFENAAGTTKTLLYQHAANDALIIKDIVNNTDRVWFGNDGDVGIGVNPSAKLDVNGTGYIRTAVFSDAFKPYSGTLATYGSSSSTDHYFVGDVGIGVTTPQNKLHVDATTTSNVVARFNTDSTYTFVDLYNDDLNRVQIGNADDGDFIIRTAEAERFRINSSGLIKVGPNGGDTTNVFEIDTSGSTQHGLMINADQARAAGRYALYIDDEDPNSRGSVVIQTASGPSLTTTGNVGIGTTSPSYKLDVSGDYRFKDTASGGALLGYHHNDSNNGLLLLVYGSAYSGGSVLSVGANGTAYHHSHTVGINAGSGSDIKFGAGGTEKFRMTSAGAFHASDDVVAFSTTPSDKKLKTNVKELDYGLDTIMKLKPKQYDWKKDNRKDIGFIAQEVEEVIPEIVKDNEWFDDKIKTLDYEKLTAVLIKAVQEQQDQINKLKEQLNG